tara:strand:- start:20805 stop:21692 length:888 start_codon:yes stop_codon:yes gene_type:complete
MNSKTIIAVILLLTLGSACQTHTRINYIAADKPATINVVSENVTVTTEHIAAKVAALEVHDIFVRGERTRIRVEVAANAKLVLVLFSGGNGVTKLTHDGRLRASKENFLIRARTYFLKRGFTTVLFDGPTDRPIDLRHGFRSTMAHATDIGAVIAHLRGRYGLPVWLLGTSRGTTSVSSAVTQLAVHKPDGVVLFSTMFVDVSNGDNVFDFSWKGVGLPILLVHHINDGCWVTPAGEIPRFRRHAKKANPLGVQLHEGGVSKGRLCGPRSFHGFAGIEERVVDAMAKWILNPRSS